MADPILAAQGVTVRHPRADRDAVREGHIALEQAEILCLVGPNGSGKSTLLSTLAGLIRPRGGRVLWRGRDLRAVGRRTIARSIGFLPQLPVCPEGVTVEELVWTGRHAHRHAFAAHAPQDQRAVAGAVRAMDLTDLKKRPVETLSGGERRRAWLAMVLAQEPEILLLDEPTTGLDWRHELELFAAIARVHGERGTTVAIATHDLEHAARFAHRVGVMCRGRVYTVAEPERALDGETLRDVFGIEARIDREDGQWCIRALGTADPVRHL